MEEKLQGLFGEQSLQLKEGVTQFIPYSNSKYPKGNAIKRYLCWPFDMLRTGLNLIVNHGELVEPRLIAAF